MNWNVYICVYIYVYINFCSTFCCTWIYLKTSFVHVQNHFSFILYFYFTCPVNAGNLENSEISRAGTFSKKEIEEEVRSKKCGQWETRESRKQQSAEKEAKKIVFFKKSLNWVTLQKGMFHSEPHLDACSVFPIFIFLVNLWLKLFTTDYFPCRKFLF